MMVCVAAIVSTVILEMETPVIIYNFNVLLKVLISTRICSSLYFLVHLYDWRNTLESLYSISF